MELLLIVKLQVFFQALASFAWTRVILARDLLTFPSALQTRGEIVVKDITLAVHADAHVIRKQ